MELPKAYDPKAVEDRIYQMWLKSGFFNPDKIKGKNKPSFCLVIPPPNITGSLHMGHALNAVIQDVLIRRKRMQGFKALWLPGTDHAGIATQNVVEKELKKEGKTRFDLGRELFLEKVWEWKQKYGNIILDQFKKLGSSCDWSRLRFTMDKGYSSAVKTAFLHYYKKGWIYRGQRVVNWCPRCQTSLSDLELEYKEEEGKLWHIRYPLKVEAEGLGRFLTVATTRPETMLGDTAVAINPKDKRYKSVVGRVVVLPIQNREIPVIADEAVDPNFGTGALKVTPAHDIIDWGIAQRHNLAMPLVIDEKGKMTKESKVCEGLTPKECREKVITLLQEKNLLEKTENHTHSLPYCYRCHSLIEPILSDQWFLKMEELAKKAIEAVKSGKIKFHPESFEKVYFDWLEKNQDWCISRQIWWGHKIPIEGENDVLDTWFSSALWPLAVLGWPQKTKDLKSFYPTSVLSTDRGIINLWVARMIFSGLEFLGEIPFSDVIIHATVLTKEGQRMSKSLGTGIDPLNLIEKYGADATRFGIAWQITGGQDVRFVEDNIAMGRKFCNKIWNASRFVLGQIPKSKIQVTNKIKIPKTKLTKADSKILGALEKTIKSVNEDLEKFRFGQAAQTLYDFFWHDFCDKYIEESKKQNNKKTKDILLYVLSTSLKLLHPFIPFITEEIFQKLPLKKKKLLLIEEWPKL